MTQTWITYNTRSPDACRTAPLHPAPDTGPNLVYTETGRNVTMAMVVGKVIYQDDHYANVDLTEVHSQLIEASECLQNRAAAGLPTSTLPIVELTQARLILGTPSSPLRQCAYTWREAACGGALAR